MAKLTLNDVTSGYLAIPNINDNWNRIETALENTLSRDGTTPNTMGANLDMNSHRIINLATPLSNSDAARWIDIVNSVVLTGTAIPSQIGNTDKVITTNGTNISWRSVQDLLGFPGSISKGDILVGTAVNTLTRKAVGTNGQLIVADSTQSDGLIWTDYTREPLNVNPNWLLDQINEGLALYTINGTAIPGPDGWSGIAVGTGVFKLRTIVDPDFPSKKVLEITCTTADAAIAASDRYCIYTAIEGYDLSDLKAGTASASQVTMMFDSDLSVAGTYGIAVLNSASNRRYIGTFTQAVANAREPQHITLTLDTAGTWLYTNGVGMYVFITLAAGTDFQATAGAWGAGAQQTTAAQVNFMSNIANIGYITPFHVIPGGVALAKHLPNFGRELQKGQRHFEKSYDQGTAVASSTNVGRFAAGSSGVVASAAWAAMLLYKQSKRGTPTITTYNPNTGIAGQFIQDDASVGPSLVPTFIGTNEVEIDFSNSAGRWGAFFQWTANARLS